MRGPDVTLAGRAVGGLLLGIGSLLDWWTWEGGPLGVVLPGSVRGYEAWSGRAALVAGVGLVLLAGAELRTGRRHPRLAALLAGVAVLAVLAGAIEMPDDLPQVITYHLQAGYWVCVAGAALGALSAAAGMVRRPS